MIIGQYLTQILTALVLMILGGWLYQADDGFFLSLGSFRGKIVAPVIVLVSIGAGIIFTPIIADFWNNILQSIGVSRIIGFIVILAMIATNSVAGWNYLDRKSILIYAVGLIILFQSRTIALFENVVGGI